MKRLTIILIALFSLTIKKANAQSEVNTYYNPQFGYYVQVIYNSNSILYRVASPQYQFIRLNYSFNNNGLTFYGSSNFQVAVKSNKSQICTISSGTTIWYNYVGTQNIDTGGIRNSYRNNTNSKTNNNYSSRCSWCNGTGRITKNDHVTQYGLNKVTVDVKCTECGITYCSTYTNHYHLNCGKCGGTGKVSR